jgi:hypothetical protein
MHWTKPDGTLVQSSNSPSDIRRHEEAGCVAVNSVRSREDNGQYKGDIPDTPKNEAYKPPKKKAAKKVAKKKASKKKAK